MADEPDVRAENSYAVDRLGIRRFVRAGDRLWPGWQWQEVESVAAETAEAPAKTAKRPAHHRDDG